MDRDPRDEVLQGYVMDVACIRKAPADELARRAAEHRTACGLMGHCIESGYGLIDHQGQLHLLDPDATAPVVQHLLEAWPERGVRILVRRRQDGEAMRTVDVARGDPSFGSLGEHIRP